MSRKVSLLLLISMSVMGCEVEKDGATNQTDEILKQSTEQVRVPAVTEVYNAESHEKFKSALTSLRASFPKTYSVRREFKLKLGEERLYDKVETKFSLTAQQCREKPPTLMLGAPVDTALHVEGWAELIEVKKRKFAYRIDPNFIKSLPLAETRLDGSILIAADIALVKGIDTSTTQIVPSPPHSLCECEGALTRSDVVFEPIGEFGASIFKAHSKLRLYACHDLVAPENEITTAWMTWAEMHEER